MIRQHIGAVRLGLLIVQMIYEWYLRRKWTSQRTKRSNSSEKRHRQQSSLFAVSGTMYTVDPNVPSDIENLLMRFRSVAVENEDACDSNGRYCSCGYNDCLWGMCCWRGLFPLATRPGLEQVQSIDIGGIRVRRKQ